MSSQVTGEEAAYHFQSLKFQQAIIKLLFIAKLKMNHNNSLGLNRVHRAKEESNDSKHN